MTEDLIIIGTPVSPYVRKVFIVLDIKGIPFRCSPRVPFLHGDVLAPDNPLRRIPVLKSGDLVLPDSSVIAQYLEELKPDPSIFPGDAATRARTRWLEEYADDHLGRGLVFDVFVEKMVRPRLLKVEPDTARIETALTKGIPDALDYLERITPADGWLTGDFSLADITVSAMFWNLAAADYSVDVARWPRVAAWLGRANAHPSVARMNALADEMASIGPAAHAGILEKYGIMPA